MKMKWKSSITLGLFFYLYISVVSFATIERYTMMDFNGKEVYFPKDNTSYIDEIMESKDSDKLLYLAEFYLEKNEEELALYYLNSYKGYNWNFKKKIANDLGLDFYTKEFVEEKYPKDKEFERYFLITDLDNLDAYAKYFATGENKEKNIYEKLFKYKTQKNDKEFDELYAELEKSVKEKGIIEEIFIFQILKEDYDAAKKTSFQKPQLFLDLINYMILNNNDKEKIKNYIVDFKENYPKLYEKELLEIEIKFILKDEEKQTKIEEFLNVNFDAEIFNLYMKITKNQDYLKNYLKKLVFEKRIEEYIVTLEKIDPSYNDEKYLKLLFDKKYIFSYWEKEGEKIPEEYKSQYITYLFDQKNYTKLNDYLDDLNFEQLKILYNDGQKEVLEKIRAKYPLEIEFADLNDIKYFYFNKNLNFDLVLVKDLERQKQLNPVETYYLSLYYNSIGDKEKAEELLYGLKDDYNLTK